jgi:protein-S-isoprenylcysteine O-methyltransferase Ste14
LTAFGVAFFVAAVLFMKNSWRVGIDKSTKTTLIREGIYRFSRNPAFIGFDLMFAGVFISYADILTLFAMLVNGMALHLLILQEEKHLRSVFGEEYAEYARQVPRYLLVR